MANSETILSSQTHPGDSTVKTVTGVKFKGDGFYGRSDGFHTVQINISGFIGRIEIQGTLVVDPSENDWFSVDLGAGTMTMDTTGALTEHHISFVEYTSSTTNNKSYNFIGNYVWVRAKVTDWTDGSINSIKLNH